MKLLFDANISWRLVSKLKMYYEGSQHVDFIGLSKPATDIEIWNYAKDNDFIITTNDEDFLNLMNVKGYPPKVILLKTGNQSVDFIEKLLIKHSGNIKSLFQNPETGLIEIF